MKPNRVIKILRDSDNIPQETKDIAIAYIEKCQQDMKEAKKVNFSITSPDLAGLFIWERTPQGRDFWSALNADLE